MERIRTVKVEILTTKFKRLTIAELNYRGLEHIVPFFQYHFCLLGHHKWRVIDCEWDWIVIKCKTCEKSHKEYIPFLNQPALNSSFKRRKENE